MTWFTFLSFLGNRLKGKRWDSFHSPYLFRLISFMADDQTRFEKFPVIEDQRKKWLQTRSPIVRQDFGSGSLYSGKPKTESINIIAKHALSLPYQCRCMARLVNLEKPVFILELGTSLGISAAYLQSGNSSSSIMTVEGDPELAKLADITFNELEMTSIELVVSTFENFLESPDADQKKIDLLFLDGNHNSKALLHYFEKLKTNYSGNTIVLVDDIYWSKDMHEGWRQLIAKPEVTQSIDCFHFGMLFFRKEFLEKENHRIRLPLKSFFSK
jgi:predicted O-methyltransferase YrrM